jgi:hypothetical protein
MTSHYEGWCPGCNSTYLSVGRCGRCGWNLAEHGLHPHDAADAQELIEHEGEPPLCRTCGHGYMHPATARGELQCAACGSVTQAKCECAWLGVGSARAGCPVCCPTGDPTDPHGTQRR